MKIKQSTKQSIEPFIIIFRPLQILYCLSPILLKIKEIKFITN
jgi:hypothetical protein